MATTRFLMVGGFLGAGKTTAIGRLARRYIDQGRRVGIVTNDQAFELVDTKTLRAQGFDVGEVPGACFCCKFDELLESAAALGASAQPDIVLAEPVGSCTDLVATVIQPLMQLYGERYDVGPLAVLLKPGHGQKILRQESGIGFSPKAAYIFLKQIEEAEIVAINKIDKLTANEQQELIDLVAARFPDKNVLGISAREGEGWEAFCLELDRPRPAAKRTLDIDYDTYAEGEAEMGWLNCSVTLDQPAKPMPLGQVARQLVTHIRDSLAEHHAEPIHLKVMAQGGDGWAVANLVSSEDDVEAARSSNVLTQRCQLVVNARVATDPQLLSEVVTSAIGKLAAAHTAKFQIADLQSFRPGRPVPTHRLSSDT